MSAANVDVVIPTLGRRPDMLWEAVRSALVQTGSNVGAVVIVVDDPDAECDVPAALSSPLIRVVRNLDRTASARSVGVEHGDSPWVAFLDDDDLWEPDKLRKQFELTEAIEPSAAVIVSSRHSHRMDGPTGPPLPGRVIGGNQSVAEYLFHKRSPRANRPSLYTSSLLAPRELCEQIGWRRIARHQDWDWLLRAERLAGARLVQHPDVLVRIRVGSPGSISRSPDWRSSLTWAQETLAPHVPAKLTADFLASQTLRYALTARSGDGTRSTLRAIRGTGAAPHPQSLMVGAAGLLPVSMIRRLLVRG